MFHFWTRFKRRRQPRATTGHGRRERRSVRPTVECLEERSLLSTVHFAVDPLLNVKPISRFIYGVNQSLDGAYANLTFERLGGNRWSAHNWENNASNAGSD